MAKVFITGATGYLGSHIVHTIAQQMPQAAVIGTTRSLKNV